MADPELRREGAQDFFENFSSRWAKLLFLPFLKNSLPLRMTFFASARGGMAPWSPLNPPLGFREVVREWRSQQFEENSTMILIGHRPSYWHNSGYDSAANLTVRI